MDADSWLNKTTHMDVVDDVLNNSEDLQVTCMSFHIEYKRIFRHQPDYLYI